MPDHLLWILCCFFLASFLKGVSGIGFSSSCIALLSLVLEPRYAIALTLLPSLSSNLVVMIQAGGFVATLRRFRFYFSATLPGVLLGVWLLTLIDRQTARTILGTVLLLFSLISLRRTLPYPCGKSHLCQSLTGLLTGVVNGLTGSQVLPVLPWLMALKVRKDVLVQTMNSSFTIANLLMLALFGRIGWLGQEQMLLSGAGIAVVFTGVSLGGRLRRRVSEEQFRRLINLLLLLLGIALIF